MLSTLIFQVINDRDVLIATLLLVLLVVSEDLLIKTREQVDYLGGEGKIKRRVEK